MFTDCSPCCVVLFSNLLISSLTELSQLLTVPQLYCAIKHWPRYSDWHANMILYKDVLGQDVSCSNEEALKWFNKGLVAYVAVRESSLPYFQAALEQDDSFALTHCILAIFYLFDLHSPNDPKVSPHLEALKKASDQDLTERERAYVQAALAYASGSLDNATKELSTMLFEYPKDGLAIRLVVGSYIVLAEFEKMRDLVARVLPFWTEDTFLYHCILAFYGFALEECREREKAEEVARKALAIDKRTPFATHAMSHIMEEAHHPREGVEFLTSTRSHWTGAVYEGHITWHLTLYYLDLGDISKVLEEFDTNLKPRAHKDNLFGLLDASSLLWRLEVMGIEVGEERWEVVTQAMTPHVHNHRSPWFDAHIMFSLARGKVSESTARLALAEGMMKSMKEYASGDIEGLPNVKTSEKLGVPVCNALLAFGQEKYDEVLQIMVPLRYKFLSFGGSWAQRQVFNTTMIQAAIKANNLSVALGLVAEMMAQKPHNPKYKELFKLLKGSCKH